MTNFLKFWSSDKKENKNSLRSNEIRLIDGRLLPRWHGEIPDGLKDQSAIDDFRVFSAQLKKSAKKMGVSS